MADKPYSVFRGSALWLYQEHTGSTVSLKTRKDLEYQLIARSFEDSSFKHQLLTEPKTAIEREFRTTLPASLNVHVLEDTATYSHLVIPHNPYEGTDESGLVSSSGLTLEDVASSVYDQQVNTCLGESASVALFVRAWRDPSFPAALAAAPHEVLARELGVQIPESREIRVLNERAGEVYVILPATQDALGNLPNLKSSDEANRLLEIAVTFTVNNHP